MFSIFQTEQNDQQQPESEISNSQNDDVLHDLNEFLKMEKESGNPVQNSQKDINDIFCPRCTNKDKICRGSRGLKIHYAHAHREFLPDLSEKSENSSLDMTEFSKKLSLYKQSIRVLKRVPKGARIMAAKKLESLVTKCSIKNDLESWFDLLMFSYIALQIPKRSSKKNKLTSIVKENINAFNESSIQVYKQKTATLSKRIEGKIADGDIKGAVRILSSNDEFAAESSSVLEELNNKHPAPSRPLKLPEPPNESSPHLIASENGVLEGISYNGSAGGIDGLRPQILKDLLSNETGDSGCTLLSSLTKLSNMMLAGNVLVDNNIWSVSMCTRKKIWWHKTHCCRNKFQKVNRESSMQINPYTNWRVSTTKTIWICYESWL